MPRRARHAAQMATRKQRVFCFLVAVAVVAWAIYFHLQISRSASLMMLVFWLACDAVVAFYLVSFAIGRRFLHFPVARGFVVGLVPTYNDSTESVHGTIRSMLAQTRPPDVIHVVDDGSKNPPEPFDHPKVIWHRKKNGGKRDAQAYVLRQLDPDTVDFFWTIDGDSEVEETALEHMLRAMSNKKVMACTGMILVRNEVLGTDEAEGAGLAHEGQRPLRPARGRGALGQEEAQEPAAEHGGSLDPDPAARRDHATAQGGAAGVHHLRPRLHYHNGVAHPHWRTTPAADKLERRPTFEVGRRCTFDKEDGRRL